MAGVGWGGGASHSVKPLPAGVILLSTPPPTSSGLFFGNHPDSASVQGLGTVLPLGPGCIVLVTVDDPQTDSDQAVGAGQK